MTLQRNDHLLQDQFKDDFIETVDHSEDKRKDALAGCENIMVIIVVDRPPRK